MPYKWVEAEVAFTVYNQEIHHTYKHDAIDDRMEYWFEFDDVEFDIRDLANKVKPEDPSDYEAVIRLAIRRNIYPFNRIPRPMKKTFTVERLIDAYAVYVQDFQAFDLDEAYEMASETDEGWGEADIREFDDTKYVVYDEDGEEVMGL